MSLSKPPHPIRDEELYLLPLIKLITCIGRDLMFRVFTYGCPNKDPNNLNKNLKDYLLQDVGMDAATFKKYFNKTQIDQIIAFPACDKFDVPLLFLAIKVACDHKIADKNSAEWFTQDYSKLEYLLKLLKDERNELLHNLPMRTKAELKPKIEELRSLLAKIIEATSDRFGVDLTLRQQYLTELNYHVDQVRDQPLTETEILEYKTLWLREYIENTLKESGAAELKEVLKKLDYINPLSFMDGYDTLINLQVVFFQMLIEHQDRFNKKTTVDLNQILQVGECATAEQSSFILVRGKAGAGKSILTKWMMLQWAKNDVQMSGLAEYDLVIPLECRNHHFDSLAKLLRSLLPNTSPKLGEDIITYIHNLKILFILDGLDQLNAASRKVVDEIMQLSKTKQHTVLCTSRSKKAKEFLYTVPDQYQKCIFDIVGIPPAEQAGFVARYHDHLIQLGKSAQSTDILVQFINKSGHLQELFKCPLILLLVVYLWACQPDKLNENTTDTELYNLVYQMLEERMKQRLLTRARANNKNGDDIDGTFERLIEYFSLEALISLSQDQGILHSTSQERLKSQFTHDDVVNFQELASTYLAYRIVEKSNVNERQLCFPSDDCHNYFAAKGLLYAIADIHQYSILRLSVMGPTELSDLQQEYEENVSNDGIITHVLDMVSGDVLDITKHTNILKHLVQLFNEQEAVLDNNEVWEVVQLLKDSGIRTRGAWLDFLAKVKCVQQMSIIIASIYFSTEKELVVDCSTVAGMTSLLPHLSPHLVTLDLPGDLDDLTHLDHLLEIIAQKKCNVEVKCWRNLSDPDMKDVKDPKLQCLLHQDAQCRVKGVAEYLYDYLEDNESSDVGVCEAPAAQNSGQSMSTATAAAPLLQQPDTSLASEVNSEAGDSEDKMRIFIDEELDLVSDEGGVKKYLVRAKIESTDEDTAKVLSFGDANGKETKCLLLLGETGAGKTTFVNAVFNHLYNINFEDSFRVCVEDQRTEDRSFTESQTDFITVFKFHHKEGMRYDSNFVIIDTPGLADTRGEEHQNRIMKDLEEFFLSDHGIDDLHCLGLTTNATINRRSLYQKEIVENILSLFGKHIPNITNILATHATEKAKVDQVLESAGVKFNKIYGFDNHVVFAPNKLGEDVQERDLKMLELRWEKTLEQFKLFFSDLLEAKPVSVTILREKKCLDLSQRSLEVSVKNLVMLWSTWENLKKDMTDYEVLKENSREYNQEKEVPKKIRLPTGRSHVHNCTKCDQTCKNCKAYSPWEKEVKDNFQEGRGAIGKLAGGVRGISRATRKLNKKQCFFHDEPCAQCGHARSEHIEENESIKNTTIKVAFVNEFMKTQFDETELKIVETTAKINAVCLEISPAKEEVATQFLNMIVCFKRVQNLSPASEIMAAQDIMEQLTPDDEQESDKASKILLGLKETVNLFDTCGVDEVLGEFDSVANVLNNIIDN